MIALSHWFTRRVIPLFPQRFQQGKMPYLFSFAILIIGVFLVFAITSPYEHGRIVPLVAIILMALLVVLVYNGLPVGLAVHAATVFGALQIVFGAWMYGGMLSPRLVWLYILPVTPFFVLGRRSGFVWFGVVLIIQWSFALTAWGTDWIPEFQMGAEHLTSSLLTFGIITVVILVVPLIYDHEHRKALQQVRLRQSELEQKKQELQKTLAARDQFISIVSHELRTPMNAILGFNALLLDQAQNKPRAKEILEHTRQSADHLMTVINDVLDFSQFESGRLKARHENFDLRHTVQAAFDLFAPRVRSLELEYKCTIDPALPQWVSSDSHRLMQILVNLIGNAIKFTHQGQVHLKVMWLNPGVRFEVLDTGIGIDPEQHLHIFKRFNQAGENTQKRYGGNGLGLAITQRLVQLLDGQIGFESTLGEGSVFWFELPLEAVQSSPVDAQDDTQESISQVSFGFLVVDDHQLNRLLVTQVLRKYWPQARITEAESGAKALTVLSQEAVDLVLMDMVMPGMDGIEATQAIRALQGPMSRVPVLGLTANVNPADLEKFTASGLQGVMLKPFEPKLLRSKVRELLQTP
jgi:signal transduction histidine kinase